MAIPVEEDTFSSEDEDTMMANGLESDETSESESESEEGDVVKLAEPSKNPIYNRDGLLDKLADIAWPEDLDWTHKLSIDIEQEEGVDVNDDLARELAFYNQALQGSRVAFEKLQAIGLPFLRPSDYYAEMVKTDNHMEKVKRQLLSKKKEIEEAEERRKAREAKKIAKEVQAQKLKERSKQKKDEIESVKKWRKQRQQSGFAAGDKGGDLMLPFEDNATEGLKKRPRPGVAPGDRSGGKGRQNWKGKKGMQKTNKRGDRDTKDSKYGFGGRKGLRKQNTAETTNDFRGPKKSFGNKKRKF